MTVASGAASIFLVHGHDHHARDRILGWLAENAPDVEPVVLAATLLHGRSVPAELERQAAACDAAIVLLTADDLSWVGRVLPFVRGSSRPNVLVELGWFWARLGLGRTFVLRDERVLLPSDLGGIWHETYRSDVLEAKDKLAAWLDGLPEAEASAVTEVVHSTSGPQRRDWEYAEVHSAARSSLIVTGIGMINVRQRIPAIVSRLKREPELEVDFVTLDREFVRENRDLLEVMYRPGLDGDLERFDDDLRRHIAGTDLAGRLRLHKSAGIMTFVATAADLDAWGSIMLVETILPVGGYEMIERPRLLLRRRCRDGLYDRFAGATRALLDEAGKVDLS